MRAIFLFGGCIAMSCASAQPPEWEVQTAAVPAPAPHYQSEFTFDAPLEPEKWSAEKPGMQVSFVSTDRLYSRADVPELDNRLNAWRATGWRGDRLNAQILIWSADPVHQVRFLLGDLAGDQGQTLAKANLQVQMVRYVISDYPYSAKNARCDANPPQPTYLMPDRLESFERFAVPARTVRPVWLSLNIPEAAEPGDYAGTISVHAANAKSEMQLRIRVQNQILPRPRLWRHRLDLWQNPWVVAWRNNLQPWSEEHKWMLKQHLKLYADAGGKYITTYAVHSPWADNSYMIEGAMIDWVKESDGSWSFDYSIFDTYVQLAIEAGIENAITIYTPIPWGNRFRYLDEATGNHVDEVWEPESDTFKRIWNVFLDDLRAHLEEKGWFDKSYLGINENALEQTLAAIKVIKNHSQDWRITYAGDWHAELDVLLDDYSCLHGKEPSQHQIVTRAARGATSTYYVCCTPPAPNTFVFSPPIEARWISWHTVARGYDGFLRWAYDAWPADPARDARHTLWPAGDCFLVYPGGAGSIRLAKLREGIVDFEKISILRTQVATSADHKAKALLEQLDQHLRLFVTERSFDESKIAADVAKGNELIAELSDVLASSRTPR
jgi:hypothetical protein